MKFEDRSEKDPDGGSGGKGPLERLMEALERGQSNSKAFHSRAEQTGRSCRCAGSAEGPEVETSSKDTVEAKLHARPEEKGGIKGNRWMPLKFGHLAPGEH